MMLFDMIHCAALLKVPCLCTLKFDAREFDRCQEWLFLLVSQFLTVTVNVSMQTPPLISVVRAVPTVVKHSKSSRRKQTSENAVMIIIFHKT